MIITPELQTRWLAIDSVVAENTARVVDAFRHARISAHDLMGSTGYGYQDRGRELLDGVAAKIFGCESGLLRAQWASGTHALATTLKACAQPGHTIWLASGAPYDTILPLLERLTQRGIAVVSPEPLNDGADLSQMAPETGDIVYVQRSRGYSGRRSWGDREIRPLVEWAHHRGAVVVVDNCYGEFTQVEEPGHWGADLVVGSLMKNPGGSVAPTGAYVSGSDKWVQRVADELFAPGIGAEVGATGPYLRLMAQGLFLAPQLVGEALKGGLYISACAERAGIMSEPGAADLDRNDIVVALELGSAERVIKFCQAIQAWEPIDAHVTPEPWAMPGYEHPVIMAAGGFVAGGSLELSADAPVRPPFRVYIQGGVNRWHTKLAVDAAFSALDL